MRARQPSKRDLGSRSGGRHRRCGRQEGHEGQSRGAGDGGRGARGGFCSPASGRPGGRGGVCQTRNVRERDRFSHRDGGSCLCVEFGLESSIDRNCPVTGDEEVHGDGGQQSDLMAGSQIHTAPEEGKMQTGGLLEFSL